MKVLIFGATSAIAHETGKLFAADGAAFCLIARNAERLASAAADLTARGALRVETIVADLDDLDAHAALVDAAWARLDGIDAALLAHGTLGDHERATREVDEALRQFNTNATTYISLLTLLGNRFEEQRRGCIAVISSVAGDRGRGSNYVYGASKSAVSAFTSGLRNRLEKVHVAVVTIKPGFVDTPMTEGMPKGPLVADRRAVGKRIYDAMLRGEDVVYTPWFWGPIMLVIRTVPERIFKKLRL